MLVNLYIIFIAIMFLTNNQNYADAFYTFIVIPLSIIQLSAVMVIKPLASQHCKRLICFNNSTYSVLYLDNSIFILVLSFMISVLIPSAMLPVFSWGWLLFFVIIFCKLVIFVLITAYVAVDEGGINGNLFIILGSIASLNAAINMFFYFGDITSLNDLLDHRLQPTWGIVPDHFSTTSALTYAIFFVISFFYFSESSSLFKRMVSFISFLVTGLALLLTASRGPIIAVVLVIFGYLYKRNHASIRLSFSIYLCFMISFLVLVVMVIVIFLYRGFNLRDEVWLKFLNIWLHNPIVGYGQRIEFRVPLSSGDIIGHAHNIMFSAIARGGIFELFLLLALIFNTIKAGVNFYKTKTNLLPVLVISIVYISGLFDFEILVMPLDWQWISFWMPFSLFISVEKFNNTRQQLINNPG